MRKYPTTDEDKEELIELNPEKWMVDVLKKNPEYTWWGNHEDYMINDKGSYSSPFEISNISELNLNDYNEIVNFYFFIKRDTHACDYCNKIGYNKETSIIYNDLKDIISYKDEIKEDEMDLISDIEYFDKYGHVDSTSIFKIVEKRAKEKGVYGYCPCCNGKTYIYNETPAKMYLQLWVIHPRKGASRGVIVNDIKKDDMPEIIKYLKTAAERNANRFSKLEEII